MSSKLTPQESTEDQSDEELQPGTKLLHGQYVVEQFLNNGGFGITYLAKDSLHRLVVIKECFPESLVRRANSTVRVRSRDQAEAFRTIVDLFIEEARNLARLSHPNIVGVHQVFEDNDTAYMAMDFVQGQDLLEIAEGPNSFKPAALEKIVVKLLDAIEFMHLEGILHRDIAPDNILLSNDNEPVLIDFGAARETVTRETSYLGSMRTVKDGYSPQEFYVNNSEQHPSSDLYSLAASLYHIMTKELPVSAQVRMTAIASGDPDPYVSISDRVEGYSEPFLEAIDHALQVFPKDRIQSAAEWRARITHTRISQITRGSVSRPMLAVDNGNIVHPFEEAAGTKAASPKRPGSPAAARITPRPAASKADKDDVFLSNAKPTAATPAPASSGKGLYIGVAAAALLAVVGGGAFIMTGTSSTPDRQVAAKVAPSTGATPVGDDQATASAPEPATPGAATQTASTEPATPAARRRPEQVPFFLAESSSGDVSVTSANGRLASGGTTRPNPETSLATAQRPEAAAPGPSRQVAGGAESSPAAAGFENSGTAAVVPTAQLSPTNIQELTPVMTAKAVRFAVVADPADPTIVQSIEGPAAEQLAPGQRVLSVNGFPLGSLADFQRVVDATSDYAIGDSVRVAFGVEDPVTGITSVRNVVLPAVQSTMLLNGIRFETVRDGDGWATFVSEASGQEQSELQTGDRIVAHMPSNDMIDQQDALQTVLQRELEAGSTQINFAVNRNGDMWLVSMPFGPATGN